MKRLLIALILSIATSASAQKFDVRPQEGAELMSVVMRLAGAEKYHEDQSVWKKYRDRVDERFAANKNHAAVRKCSASSLKTCKIFIVTPISLKKND